MDDLISRSKLLNTIDENARLYGLTCANKLNFMDIVRRQEAVYAEQKWISVKDRLPEPDTKVLVYGRNEYGVYCITCLYSAHRKWLYHNRTTADGETITHWMPLPEPPKEESTT